MHKLLEKLHKDHGNLGKILDLLNTQLDHFFAHGESDFDLKIELMEYLEAYADQGHHPTENVLFDMACERDHSHRGLFDKLKQQHSDLDRLTRTFRKSLENIYNDGMMPRDELEVQGREYVALQRKHIVTEEQEAFPLLESCLSEQDWEEALEKAPNHGDPVFDTPDRVRFQRLVEYLEGVEKSA